MRGKNVSPVSQLFSVFFKYKLFCPYWKLFKLSFDYNTLDYVALAKYNSQSVLIALNHNF